MGTSPDRVASEMGKFLESMEKLKPQPTGVWESISSGLSSLLGGSP
jgi:hypothetical protein